MSTSSIWRLLRLGAAIGLTSVAMLIVTLSVNAVSASHTDLSDGGTS